MSNNQKNLNNTRPDNDEMSSFYKRRNRKCLKEWKKKTTTESSKMTKQVTWYGRRQVIARILNKIVQSDPYSKGSKNKDLFQIKIK